jgi:hypothetical protein
MQYRLRTGSAMIALVAMALASLRVPSFCSFWSNLLLMGLLINAAFSSIYLRGRKQAFWLGFLAAFMIQGGLPFNLATHAVPNYEWVAYVADYAAANFWGSTPQDPGSRNALYSTLVDASMALVSLMGGFIAGAVYTRSRVPNSQKVCSQGGER